MKIAINTTSAVAGGGVTYIKNLLNYLSKINAPHQYFILTTITGKEMFSIQHPNFNFLSFKIPSKNSILRLCWEQIFLPIFLAKKNIDILFSPANVCPLFTKITNVVLIQNIEPFSNSISIKQGLTHSIRLKLLKLITLLSIKKSKKVIIPSVKARNDIEKYGISLKHSEVIYHGINKEVFYPCSENSKAYQVKKKYGLDKFILYVSNIQRYKNFLELVKAFVLLKDRIDNNITLVFAGECLDKAYYNEILSFVAEQKYEDRIIFLGSVPHEKLPYLYSTCMMFVYPSTCESFGMPLVEAMACGAPILASKIEPVPEICAEAAIYFNPKNPDEIAAAIFKTLADEELISALTKNALKRADIFSLENSIRNTLCVLESIETP